jgi:hypothetical protein
VLAAVSGFLPTTYEGGPVSEEEEERPPWESEGPGWAESQFAQPIGELMMAHSWIDFQLELILASLLGMAQFQRTQAVLSQISNFEARVDLFSQLAHLTFADGSRSALVKEIHDGLDDINGARNRIVHGRLSSYSWPPLKIAVVRSRPRDEKFGTKNYFYTPDEISAITKKIYTLGLTIGRLRWEVVSAAEKDTSPDKPR